MPIKYSIGKTYLVLLLISTILTSIVTGFVYGVYQNFQAKATDGEAQEYNLYISATGTVGIKTKHSEFYGNSETEIKGMQNYYSSISKGDVVKMFGALPESVLNDIEFVSIDVVADDNVYGLMSYGFTFTPTKDGLIPYGLDAEQFTDDEYKKGKRIAKVDKISYTAAAQNYRFGRIYWTNNGGRQLSKDEKYIEINGVKYEIAGTVVHGLNNGEIKIPFTALPDDTPICSTDGTIEIQFKNMVTYSNYKTIKDYVDENLYDKAKVDDLDLSLSTDLYYYKTIVLITLVVTFIFTINAVAIYSCIVKKNRRTIRIYRLCGCTSGKIIVGLSGYIVLLTAPLFIISQIVFAKFIYPVMLDYFPDMVGSFNFKVYAFMFAAWLIITIASVVILLKMKTHKRLNIMEDE